ncbi:hypothetical protein [Caulobacter sp.]|uniref:hypothetical protein n=1 Tax=Caulobacter sp. TaxID=78 RepID=UPI001B191937|nr:hypothetical protein [Caulobacter sp.]MBO9545773.1 hypothetical protein [Caulobacter sp.]
MTGTKAKWVWGVVATLWCLLVGALLSWNRILSLSVDSSYHLQVMEVVRHAFIIAPQGHEFMAEMAIYPKLSHRLAALAASLGWPEINALLLVGVTSAAIVWLTLFDQARRVSLGFMAMCGFFAVVNVFVTRAAFGGELVDNFFYPQIVGEAVAALALAGGGVLLLRWRPVFVAYAAAAVLLAGCFHLVPTLKLAGAFMAMLGVAWLRDLIHARRFDWVGLVGLFVILGGVVGSPFFWRMRWMAANNGSLHLAAPLTLEGLAAAAVILLLLSAWILIVELMRAPGAVEADEKPTASAVLLASFGAAAAAAMLAQYAMWVLKHDGSPYAVMKHSFGVFSMLAFVVPLWGLTVLGLRATSMSNEPPAWVRAIGPAPAFAAQLVVMLCLFLRPSVFDVPKVNAILRDVREVRLTRGLEGEKVMFSTTGVPPITTYMGTIAMLKSPHGGNVLSLMHDGRPDRPGDVPFIVTLAGDAYDKPGCRSGAPLGLVVVVVGACVEPPSLMFKAGGAGVPYLREGWGQPELGGVWSNGKRAIVDLPISPAQRTLANASVQVAAFAFLPTNDSTRTVTVSVPGGAPETFTFNRQDAIRHDYLLALPPEALKGQFVRVTFDIKDPKTPLELGLGTDTRLLGVGLEAMRIIPTPTLR